MILACPFCKAKANTASTTCSSCGKLMSRGCPACAETIAANSTSCKYCGEGVAPLQEPAPVKADPGIVFIEETPRKKKKCCGGGRAMFWMIVLALAGFCAYSAVKSNVSNCRQRVKQQITVPAENIPKGNSY